MSESPERIDAGEPSSPAASAKSDSSAQDDTSAVSPRIPWRERLRRRSRFGLRGLLVLMTLAAILFATVGMRYQRYRRQQRATEYLIQQGAHIEWDSHPPTWLPIVPSSTYSRAFREVVCIGLPDPPPEGLQLDCLAEFENLEMLGLPGCELTPTVLNAIERMPRLVALDLSNTNIKDEDLARLTNLKQLGFLELSGTPITDAALVDLEDMNQLWHLAINHTSISDAGIDSLAKIPTLEGLECSNTLITDEGLRALEEQRPHVIVSDD